jgi:hypothetical protein
MRFPIFTLAAISGLALTLASPLQAQASGAEKFEALRANPSAVTLFQFLRGAWGGITRDGKAKLSGSCKNPLDLSNERLGQIPQDVRETASFRWFGQDRIAGSLLFFEMGDEIWAAHQSAGADLSFGEPDLQSSPDGLDIQFANDVLTYKLIPAGPDRLLLRLPPVTAPGGGYIGGSQPLDYMYERC